jgi:hypothetical protein
VKYIAYMERREMHTKFYLDSIKGTDNLGNFDIRCKGNTELDLA